MDKRILIGVLLIAIMLVSGCAVSNYIEPKETEKSADNFSLLNEKEFYEKELEEEGEIENATEEVIEEIKEENATEQKTEQKEEAKLDESEYDFTINVKENELVKLKPKASDPDKDTIKYTFSEPLDEEGKWKTNYGDAGKYPVTVTASDGKLVTTKNVLIIVERVNVPPVIEGVSDKITVDEGETLRLSPKIYDPNGDDFDVTISEPVGDDGVWEIDYQSAGEYDITILASDGELDAKKTIKLVVNKKNVAPIIADIEDIEISEGEILKLEPEVTDLNGDKVNITISEPVGNDGVWEIGYTDAGEYEITIKADDGKAITTKVVKVTVEDVNMPPEIIDIVNEGGEEPGEETENKEE